MRMLEALRTLTRQESTPPEVSPMTRRVNSSAEPTRLHVTGAAHRSPELNAGQREFLISSYMRTWTAALTGGKNEQP